MTKEEIKKLIGAADRWTLFGWSCIRGISYEAILCFDWRTIL